jgi:hypothetical protein
MFLNLAYSVVEKWWPAQVILDDAAKFTNIALDLMLAVGLFVYLLYRFLLWRFWRTDDAAGVNNLRGPWWLGLIAGIIAQWTISFILGLSLVPDKDFPIYVAIILTGAAAGILAAIWFWLLSLFSSPMRSWLAPPLRAWIFGLLGITR